MMAEGRYHGLKRPTMEEWLDGHLDRLELEGELRKMRQKLLDRAVKLAYGWNYSHHGALQAMRRHAKESRCPFMATIRRNFAKLEARERRLLEVLRWGT